MPQIIFDLVYCLLFGVIMWSIKELVPLIRAKLESTKYSWAAEIIDYAVRAYEQTVAGPGMGESKYKLVSDYVIKELETYGITLTDKQISMLIEAAVQVMNAEKVNTISFSTDTLEDPTDPFMIPPMEGAKPI